MKKRSMIVVAILILSIMVLSCFCFTGCLFSEFKKWGETYVPLDEIDNRIDISIGSYYYIVRDRYKNRTSVKDDMYWDDLYLNLYQSLNSTLTLKKGYKQSFVDSLNTVVIDEGKDFARYFYAMHNYCDLINREDERYTHSTTRDFKEQYWNFLQNYDPANINAANAMNCVPELAFAKNTWIIEDSKNHNEAKNKVISMIENKPLCKEKVDGSYMNAFMLNSLYAQVNTYTADDLKDFLSVQTHSLKEDGTRDYGADGAALLMYAACGINPRQEQKKLGLSEDIIEHLLNNLHKVGSKPAGEPINLVLNDPDKDINDPANKSISLLYLGLLAYKFERSKGTPTYVYTC